MPLPLSLDASIPTSIGIFKPKRPYSMDQVVEHFTKISKYFEHTGSAKTAILRNLNQGSWGKVAMYTVWKKEAKGDNSLGHCSGMDAFQRAVSVVAEIIELGWYEISCKQKKDGVSCFEISNGDVVNIRGILAEPNRQDLLSYSCLAVLRAYFSKIDGLSSCAFYRSLDEKRMVEVGIWENEETATASKKSPGEPYWKDLGAKLRHGLYKVIHAPGE